MPYSLYRDGKQFCVKNSDTGESKGCSSTRKMAVAHMRALYAAESGAKMGKKEIDQLVQKSLDDFDREEAAVNPDENIDKSMDMPMASFSYTATSYAQLKQLQSEAEVVSEVNDAVYAFPTLAANILADPTISDKSSAVSALGAELADIIKGTADGNEEKARADVSEADKKRAVQEYGNVKYADPENKKYPIDDEGHIRAAWSYIGQAKNQKKYSSSKVASIKRAIISAWKDKIDPAGPPKAQKKELSLAEQVAEGVKDAFTSLFSKEKAPNNEDGETFLIWKEGGNEWHWVARYSNNFRDRDIVPEIITAEAHKKFIEKVDKGLAPYPELWLWHRPEWKLGKADLLTWDDIGDGTGFAIASGHSYPGTEGVFEWLSNQKSIGVSHGMPPHTVRYDEDDPTIITEYESVEVSPLPSWAAANELGDFLPLKKEAEMAIPDEKRKALISWGMPQEMIDMLEQVNKGVAKEAEAAGIEHKEKEVAEAAPTAETVAEPPKEEVVQGTTEETPAAVEAEKTEEVVEESAEEKALNQPPTRKELAEAISAVILPVLQEQGMQIKELTEKLNAMQKTEEEKVKETIASTPLASLTALLQDSIIGRKEAQVDGRDELVKGRPAETTAVERKIGIPFLDTMIAQKKAQ